MTHPARALAASVLLLLTAVAAFAQTAPSITSDALRAQPVAARNGMVVAQEKLAARIGVEILQKGGNAVDAAVAVGYALAVLHPTGVRTRLDVDRAG